MDLDELKRRWDEQERSIETSIRLNRRLLAAAELNRMRSALQRLIAGLAFEIAVDAVGMGLLGVFLAGHIGTPRWALPAIALDLFLLAGVIDLGRQIAAASAIDHGQPVAAIQTRLARLRILRLRHFRWVLLLAPLLWTPLLIVGSSALGVDAYRAFGIPWLAANVAFGVLVILLGAWASRRFAAAAGRSPFARRLMDDVAGRSLQSAEAFLVKLSDLEDEARAL